LATVVRFDQAATSTRRAGSRERQWKATVDETDASFVVRDRFERPAADSLLTRDEARRIAASLEKRRGLLQAA
jgi:hypothetical protein